MTKSVNEKTKKLVLGSIMTALVVLLQSLATYTTFFGPFSTAIGLIPIVLGAAMCGPAVSTWLGFVFGVVVLATGNANLFLSFNVIGTFITVLVKGTACGFVAGITYKLISKFNKYVAVIVSAILCPVTNTAVFLLGCGIFFTAYAGEIGSVVGLTVTGMDLFFALAMANFVFEIIGNVVLSPIIVRIVNIKKFS